MKAALLKSVFLVFMLSLAITPRAQANSQDFGDYVVYYSAFPSDFLQADVARSYHIRRSGSRGLLNITVLKKVMNTPGTPITAKVSTNAVNLTGQGRHIDMREIDEKGAIYYLGEFNVSNAETFDFTVSVTIDGLNKPLTVQFRQQFFVDQ